MYWKIKPKNHKVTRYFLHMDENKYDLAFVGSGIACSYTIINWFKLIENLPVKKKIKIIIIDKVDEFWCGIPYGSRSGFNSLVITTLREFLPNEELDLFKIWLRQNMHWAFNDYHKNEGILSSNWFAENMKLMNENFWDEIYLPRYIFGYYMRERITYLLEKAKKNNLLEYFLLKSEVINIEKAHATYKLLITDGVREVQEIETEKVVLSIGSPPKKKLASLNTITLPSKICFIEDIYRPKLEENLKLIYKTLVKSTNKEHNNILIIGSNASALETAYNIMDIPGLSDLINKFYFISRDGEFPSRIDNLDNSNNYMPLTLNNLKKDAKISSRQILDAVKKDVELAVSNKLSISNIVNSVSSAINDLLIKLNDEERKIFVNTHGVEIGKLQRRAGKDYRDNIDNLMSRNKLQILKGEFTRLTFKDEKVGCIEYKDIVSSENRTFTAVFKCVVNCGGFEPLNLHCTSDLIRNLIVNNICRPNDSERGFRVNENFEADKNFFVIGPLLAGNMNKSMMVWHAESCSRIFYLSRKLAEVLQRIYIAKPNELSQKRNELPSTAIFP